ADVLAAVSEKNETAVPGPEKEIEGVGPLTAGADRPRRERPPRKKLEDLDDSFLKVDYFDVDPSLLRDAPKGGHGGDPAQRKGSDGAGVADAAGGAGEELVKVNEAASGNKLNILGTLRCT